MQVIMLKTAHLEGKVLRKGEIHDISPERAKLFAKYQIAVSADPDITLPKPPKYAVSNRKPCNCKDKKKGTN